MHYRLALMALTGLPWDPHPPPGAPRPSFALKPERWWRSACLLGRPLTCAAGAALLAGPLSCASEPGSGPGSFSLLRELLGWTPDLVHLLLWPLRGPCQQPPGAVPRCCCSAATTAGLTPGSRLAFPRWLPLAVPERGFHLAL